jgi:hypothetical protein
MKKLILLLILFASGYISIAQTALPDISDEELKLQQEATKMCNFFLEKKFPAYIKYVHPKVIQMVGGEKAMIDVLENTFVQLKEQGFTFNKASMGHPSSIITAGKEQQAIIPQILEMKNETGTLVSTSYLVAISSDKGKTWQFIDTGGKTLAEMKKVFPNLSNALVIPPKKQPVFNKD